MKFHYVYRLVSRKNPDRHYTGITNDLATRLAKHNRGEVPYTSKNAPWYIDSAHAFTERDKAARFEAYLKTHSGREFAKRHF